MTWTRLESLRGEMNSCMRCSTCKMIPMPAVRDEKYVLQTRDRLVANYEHAWETTI